MFTSYCEAVLKKNAPPNDVAPVLPVIYTVCTKSTSIAVITRNLLRRRCHRDVIISDGFKIDVLAKTKLLFNAASDTDEVVLGTAH